MFKKAVMTRNKPQSLHSFTDTSGTIISKKTRNIFKVIAVTPDFNCQEIRSRMDK